MAPLSSVGTNVFATNLTLAVWTRSTYEVPTVRGCQPKTQKTLQMWEAWATASHFGNACGDLGGQTPVFGTSCVDILAVHTVRVEFREKARLQPGDNVDHNKCTVAPGTWRLTQSWVVD